MYFPTTRVLTVLELLQSHQQMSGPEMARRLEVDIRTVRRYITMLQDLGIPVEAERGRHGTYRLRPGFKLPPMMFTEEEALACTLGLLAARKLSLVVAAPAVEGALAKIERVLPATLRERVQAVQETLVFDFSLPSSSIAPRSEIVGTLCAAVQQGYRVYLRYQSWHSAITERAVDLYGLVYRSGYWYAIGYCHLREDVRVFRLDRIVDVEKGQETYIRPTGFDCLEYVTHALATMPDDWLIDVLLETTLKEAQQMVPPELATLEQADDGVVFRCFTKDLDWIAYVLAGLNCPLVIRQPVELRESMRRLAEKIAKTAER